MFDYWWGRKGSLVDVGACDGVYLSNSRALLEAGWTGLLIEPHPGSYGKLVENSKDLSVETINCACGDVDGEMEFNVAPPVLAGLGEISSLLPLDELERISNAQGGEAARCFALHREDWTRCVVPVCTLGALWPHKIDLLLVDAEGYDLHVLKGVDWQVNSPEMVVAEKTIVDVLELMEYMCSVGYEIHHSGIIDLFFVKKGG